MDPVSGDRGVGLTRVVRVTSDQAPAAAGAAPAHAIAATPDPHPQLPQPPRTGARGRDRRRDHRHVDRLPPGRAGLDRHGAARARPPHVRDDLARRRADGHVRLDLADLDRAAHVHQGPVLPARGRDRAGDGLPADRADRGRGRRRTPRGVPAGLCLQPALRGRRPRDQRPGGRRAVPGRPHRRHPRGVLHAHRRAGEPRRRHDGPGQGRAHARGDSARGDSRDRRADPRRRGRRRAHARRRHRVRVRRQRRGHVGPSARRALGGEHPAAGRRALLPDHRGDAGGRPGLARPGGPEQLHLHPTRGRRPDGRAVRDGLRAVERRSDPRGLLVRDDRAGLGPDGALRRGRDEPGARDPGRGDPHVLLRPRVVHAGPAAGDRRGARGAQLLRGRRAELDRHPHRRRVGSGDRALDHHGIAGHRHHGREHRPPAPLPGHAALPGDAHRREPGHGLRVPLPGALDAHRAGGEALAAARAHGRAGRVVQGRLRVGGHRLVRRRWGRPL